MRFDARRADRRTRFTCSSSKNWLITRNLGQLERQLACGPPRLLPALLRLATPRNERRGPDRFEFYSCQGSDVVVATF